MSWLVVGDSKHATFACDTGMVGFGPLLSEYGGRDARHELREFAKTLDEDPRKLDREGKLRGRFDRWRRRRRNGFAHKFEVGDYALDDTEPTPSPEANTVRITKLIDARADEHVIEETGKTVAEHNPYYPTDDAVVAGVYPNMGGDKTFHFPESRLRDV